MVAKDFDYITYDERLFRLQFETPLDNLTPTERIEHTLDTVSAVIDSFEFVVHPTEVEFQLTDEAESTVHEETLEASGGLSSETIVDAIRETADRLNTPIYPGLEITSGVRITLSDGVYRLGGGGGLSDVERQANPSSDISTPLEIDIGHVDYMMPCLTETVTVVGHSDHWLDGDEQKFYLPEATPLAKLDQLRLAAALSDLYDAVDPVEIVFDTFENTEGWNTPEQTVPAYRSLQVRHAVEWVLDNFEQRHPDENSLELEYVGDEVHPLITHTQGSSPDEKVQWFLGKAIPGDRYGPGATATVHYPDDEAVFVRESRIKWVLEEAAEL